MRWPRQVVSLVFLAVLLVGPPVVLVRFVGWPVPTRLPTGEQLRSWVAQPLTEQTVRAVLVVLAWLVWVWVAGVVVVGVLARLRVVGWWLRRMPLPTPMQATAGGIAGAAVFGVGAGTASPPSVAVAGDRVPAAADAPGAVSEQGRGDQPPGDPRVAVGPGAGVVLPDGGWVPRAAAEQIAAAVGLVWLRRRRGYRPGQPATDDNADGAPLPATAAAVQAALSPDADVLRGAEPVDLERATASAAAGQVLRGPGGDLPLVADGLPAAGVGLTGAGAIDAARGMVVTVLLTGLRRGPDEVRLITTGADLAVMLGDAAGLAEQVAGVRVAATTGDAVAVFEAELRRRTRPDDPGPVRPDGNGSSGDGPAPLVLLTRTPTDQGTARRLATALTDGAGSAVLLGVWPAGRTWQVDAAGHVQDSRRPDTAARRLCVLGAVAATDLLTVIGQACPGRQPDPHPTSAAALPDQGAAVSVPRVPRQATSPDEPPVTRLPGPDARQVDVRLLGEPAVEFGGKPVTIRRSAAVQVLVFLAVHRQGASAVQLVEAIWPGLAAHTVTGRLYTTVSELRTTLQAACDGPVVERVGDRYRLIPDRLMVDLWQLRDSVHHAATAVAAVQGATAWRAVIDRYTGELAAGHDWPWLAGPREATRRQVIDAYAALAAVEPDPQAALRLLQDAIRVDLFNEDLHRRAVHALSAVGDYQAAVVLLDGYTQRLADVHLEVGEDLRQIAAALRAGRMLQPG